MKIINKIDYEITYWITKQTNNVLLKKFKQFLCYIYHIDYISGCWKKTGCPAY